MNKAPSTDPSEIDPSPADATVEEAFRNGADAAGWVAGLVVTLVGGLATACGVAIASAIHQQSVWAGWLRNAPDQLALLLLVVGCTWYSAHAAIVGVPFGFVVAALESADLTPKERRRRLVLATACLVAVAWAVSWLFYGLPAPSLVAANANIHVVVTGSGMSAGLLAGAMATGRRSAKTASHRDLMVGL